MRRTDPRWRPPGAPTPWDDSTPIFHITHLDNLDSMTGCGALWCDNRRASEGLDPVGIAHSSIKRTRAGTPVPCGPGGTLADYVPFYFAPRSPMLCSIYYGKVRGYGGSQSEIVHLVASAEEMFAQDRGCVFTNGHGIMVPMTRFYDDPSDLDAIDWRLMHSRYWADDPATDNDRTRRRQAEFLVHSTLHWSAVRLYRRHERGDGHEGRCHLWFRRGSRPP